MSMPRQIEANAAYGTAGFGSPAASQRAEAFRIAKTRRCVLIATWTC